MLEQEIIAALQRRGIPFTDGTRSHTALDFTLTGSNIHIDAKEKRQKFSAQNWSILPADEEFLFIIDDLAVRKLLAFAPGSFCIILDSSSTPHQYYVYSIVDFLCIPRKRVRRPIHRTVPGFKGKWLISLRDAASFESVEDALSYVIEYEKQFPLIFRDHIDCWGNYRSEQIPTAGSERTPGYWERDSNKNAD